MTTSAPTSIARGIALALLLAGSAHAATPIDETRPLQPSAEVSIDNVKGSIHVETWDRPEIHIGGTLGDNVEALEIDGDAGDLRVRVKNPESRGWFGGGGDSGDTDLRISLPPGVALSIDAVSAEVHVRGVAGKRLEIDAVSGDIDVETGAQDVEVDSVSGDVLVQARSREVSLESVSGDVTLRGEVADSISLESVSGDITVQNAAAPRSLTAGVVSGDIELQTALAGSAKLSAESLSGDLEVVLPRATSAKLTASSFTGELRSDAGNVRKPEHGPGSNLDVVLGDGRGEITLETFSGDLTIRLQ